MRQFKKFWKLYQSIIAAIIMLLAGLMIIFGGIFPAGRIIWETIQGIRETSREVSELKRKLTLLDSIDESTLAEQLKLLLLAIPADKSTQSLLSTVDNMISKSGSALIDMTVANAGGVGTEAAQITMDNLDSQKTGANTFAFSLAAQGELQQLVNLVTEIFNVRRLLRTKSFTFNLVNPSSPELRLVIEAFYAPLPKLASVTSDEVRPLTESELTLYRDLQAIPEPPPAPSQPAPSPGSGVGKLDPFSH